MRHKKAIKTKLLESATGTRKTHRKPPLSFDARSNPINETLQRRDSHSTSDTPGVKTSLRSAPGQADAEATRHATRHDDERQGWHHGIPSGSPSVRARQPDNRRAARQRSEASVGGSGRRRGRRAAPHIGTDEPFGSPKFPGNEPFGSPKFPDSTIADSGTQAVPDSQLSTDVESTVADRAVLADTTGGPLATHTTGASYLPGTSGINQHPAGTRSRTTCDSSDDNAPRTGTTGAQPQSSTGAKLRRSHRAEGRYRPYPDATTIREKLVAQLT